MDTARKRITLIYLLHMLKQTQGAYGYDIWIDDTVREHSILWHCAVEILKSEPPPPYTPPTVGRRVMTFGEDTRESQTAKEIFPLVLDILWLLSRRGILRPGVRQSGGQSVERGQGYSLTLKGREWLNTCSEEDIEAMGAEL